MLGRLFLWLLLSERPSTVFVGDMRNQSQCQTFSWVVTAAVACWAISLAVGSGFANDEALAPVDTALIVAVDVSQSVDQKRYRLQMEGIAQSLEDPDVLQVILNGPNGGILFAMMVWADKPELVIDWQRITTEAQARHVASLVRSLPHKGGEFTCMARMMDHIATLIVPYVPVPALRTVLDVSGDGIDNCTVPETVDAHRQALTAQGVTINGLPILQLHGSNIVGSGAYRKPGFGLRNMARGPDTGTTRLDDWFKTHVIAGPGAFLLTAKGYKDFGRAFRQKFVIEVSGKPLPTRSSVAGVRWQSPPVVTSNN